MRKYKKNIFNFVIVYYISKYKIGNIEVIIKNDKIKKNNGKVLTKV